MAFWNSPAKRAQITKRRLGRKADRGNAVAQQKLDNMKDVKRREKLEEKLKGMGGPTEEAQERALLAGSGQAGAMAQSVLSEGGPEAASDPEKIEAAMEAGGEIMSQTGAQAMSLEEAKAQAKRGEVQSQIDSSFARTAGAAQQQAARRAQTASLIVQGVGAAGQVAGGVGQASMAAKMA
jgi:hypothetical protein